MERIAMSQEERDVLDWLKRAKEGSITQREAAQKMDVSDRWVRTLLRRMSKRGDAVVVHGLRGRPSNRKLAADSETSPGDSEAAGLARFWADVRRRTVGQAAPDPGGQRDAARVDDRGRNVAEQVAPAARGALLAAAAERLWGTGAVGHLGARLAGRKRAGALPGADDRRRYQLELGPLRGVRCDTSEHGRAVGVPGKEWPHGGCLHGSRFVVCGAAATRREQRRTARGRPADATGARLTGIGNWFHPGVFAPGQGTYRAKLLNGPGSFGETSASGESLDSGRRQCVSGERILAGVERALRPAGGRLPQPSSGADAAAGSGRHSVSRRRACDRQRLHVLLRWSSLPDRARRSASGDAPPAGARGTPAGRRVEGTV